MSWSDNHPPPHSCSYDYLTIREDDFEDVPNSADLSLHPGLGPSTAAQDFRGHPNMLAHLGAPSHSHPGAAAAAGPAGPAGPLTEVAHLGLEGHVVVGKGHHRYCGDWSEKLKLLR